MNGQTPWRLSGCSQRQAASQTRSRTSQRAIFEPRQLQAFHTSSETYTCYLCMQSSRAKLGNLKISITIPLTFCLMTHPRPHWQVKIPHRCLVFIFCSLFMLRFWMPFSYHVRIFPCPESACNFGTCEGKSTDFAPSLRSMLLGTTSSPHITNLARVITGQLVQAIQTFLKGKGWTTNKKSAKGRTS